MIFFDYLQIASDSIISSFLAVFVLGIVITAIGICSIYCSKRRSVGELLVHIALILFVWGITFFCANNLLEKVVKEDSFLSDLDADLVLSVTGTKYVESVVYENKDGIIKEQPINDVSWDILWKKDIKQIQIDKVTRTIYVPYEDKTNGQTERN